jgi:membrane carboxypeptidase/penicillin-binding protein PbpC
MEIQRILQKPAWYNEELRKRALEEILRAGTQNRPLDPENVKVEFEEDKYKLEKAAYSLLQELKAKRKMEPQSQSPLQEFLDKKIEELAEERWRENKERLSQAPDAVTDAANKLLTLELKKLGYL